MVHFSIRIWFREFSPDQDVVTESKYGSVQYRLPGSPFATTCGKDSATLGKKFVRRLLQELHVIGYDVLCSVDLSRAYDQGTLIFKKSLISGQRLKPNMIAVAPYSNDKIHLLNCPEGAIFIVKDAVAAVWKPGIKSDQRSATEENLYEIKLRGTPWNGDSSDESIMARKLLIEIVGRLSLMNWKFHCAVNIRNGCGNCLYFFQDERYAMTPSDFAVLSPGRWDRLRLISFDKPALEGARLTVVSRILEVTSFRGCP